MPIYFCHGFRWQRKSIRVYVVVQDLDDASPDSIITPNSSQCLLDSFYQVFDFLPHCSPPPPRSRSRSPLQSSSSSTTCCLTSQSWSPIKLLEEYDPHDLSAVSRPYAYVADYAVRIDLSASISDHITAYEAGGKGKSATGWFEKLRDQLQRNEEIKWYIVVNEDEVRDFSFLNDPSYSSDSNSSKTSRARDYIANRDADLPDGHDYNDGDDKDEKGSIRTTRGPQKQQQPADPEAMGQYNLTLQQILFAENRDSNEEVKGKKEQSAPPPPPPEKDYRHQNQRNQSRSQSSLGAGGSSGAKTTGGPSTSSSSTPPTSRSDSLEAKAKQSPEGNSNSKPRSGLKRLFGRGRSVTNTDD